MNTALEPGTKEPAATVLLVTVIAADAACRVTPDILKHDLDSVVYWGKSPRDHLHGLWGGRLRTSVNPESPGSAIGCMVIR